MTLRSTISIFIMLGVLLIASSASYGRGATAMSKITRRPTAELNLASGNPVYERNKTNVLAFYDLMFNQSKPAEAMRLFGGKTYTQHNPEVPDGKAAFIAYFEQMAKDYPGKSIEFKRVFADGDFVILHSVHRFPGWRGGQWAAMDVFLCDDDGKLIEHWDVLQKVPDKSANNNGVF